MSLDKLVETCGRMNNLINDFIRQVPLRWLSIEAMKDNLYSSKSDVWAFAIVLWEIGTLGKLCKIIVGFVYAKRMSNEILEIRNLSKGRIFPSQKFFFLVQWIICQISFVASSTFVVKWISHFIVQQWTFKSLKLISHLMLFTRDEYFMWNFLFKSILLGLTPAGKIRWGQFEFFEAEFNFYASPVLPV